MDTAQDRTTYILTSLVVSVVLHASLFGGYWVYATYVEEEDPIEEVKEKELPDQVSSQAGEKRINQSPPMIDLRSLQNEEPLDLSDPAARKQMVDQQLAELEREKEKKRPNTVVHLPSQMSATRTTAEQVTGEVPQKADHEGVHNTVEQTTANKNPNAPDRLAVDGRDLNNQSSDVFESTFKDGDPSKQGDGVATDQNNVGNPDSKEISDLIDGDFDEILKRLNPLKEESKDTTGAKKGDPTAEQQTAEAKTQAEKDIERLNSASTMDVEKKIAASQSQAEQDAKAQLKENGQKDGVGESDSKSQTPKQTVSEAELVSNPKPVSQGVKDGKLEDPFSKAAGMASQVNKNNVDGSFGKKGLTTAKNVLSTESGKYKYQAIRSIEKVYVKLFSEHRSIIDYGGFAKVTLHVNSKGEMVYRSITATHPSQKSFSLLVLQNSNLLKMNEKLRKSQDGVPLVINFTIQF